MRLISFTPAVVKAAARVTFGLSTRQAASTVTAKLPTAVACGQIALPGVQLKLEQGAMSATQVQEQPTCQLLRQVLENWLA